MRAFYLAGSAAILFTYAAVAADELGTSAGPVTITPVRHASLMLQAGGKVVHVDPWGAANYDNLPAADLVLITHEHGDHFDPAALEKVVKADTGVVAPAAVAAKYTRAASIEAGDTREWNGWKIEAVHAYNLEGRHEKGAGVGYVLTYGGKRIYIAGDTDGTPEMKALKDIDIAFVPMNPPYTMSPAEAAAAVRAFKPAVVYPYHFRGSDVKAFEAALAGSGVEVRLRDWY